MMQSQHQQGTVTTVVKGKCMCQKKTADTLLSLVVVIVVVSLCVLYALSNHRNYYPSYHLALTHSTYYNLPSYDEENLNQIVDLVLSEGWVFKVTDMPVTNCYGLTVYKDKTVMLWSTDDYVVLHELGHCYGYITQHDTSEEYADAFAAAWIE